LSLPGLSSADNKKAGFLVLFLTEGGANIGLGHISRCAALGQAIGSLEPAADIRYIIKGDKKALSFSRDQGIEPVLSDWTRGRIDRSLLSECGAVVIDSYLAPARIYSSIYAVRPKPMVIAIDDYNRIRYAADVVVSAYIYGNRAAYKAPKGIKTRYLADRMYVIVRKEFRDVHPRTPGGRIKDVLVTSGGISNKPFVDSLLGRLSESFPETTFHVVGGYYSVPSAGGNIKAYRGLSAADMLKLMLKCDACFSAGGQTLYELAMAGVPTIGICFSENQKLNLKTLSEKGVIEYIGWFNGPEIRKKAVDALEKLGDYATRMKMSRKARSFIDGKGADRIARWILRA
jgi:UDP-2,4-diacetamido-2,4,6-trideoxy-beta-L-altropyranose hydrolase